MTRDEFVLLLILIRIFTDLKNLDLYLNIPAFIRRLKNYNKNGK